MLSKQISLTDRQVFQWAELLKDLDQPLDALRSTLLTEIVKRLPDIEVVSSPNARHQGHDGSKAQIFDFVGVMKLQEFQIISGTHFPCRAIVSMNMQQSWGASISFEDVLFIQAKLEDVAMMPQCFRNVFSVRYKRISSIDEVDNFQKSRLSDRVGVRTISYDNIELLFESDAFFGEPIALDVDQHLETIPVVRFTWRALLRCKISMA
ncbi:hypothetical protein D3C71_1113440 [compost metagenome]